MTNLTEEDIKKINKRIMQRSSGTYAPLHEANISHAIRKPQEPYKVMAGLIHGHGFLDGNKRTALISSQILAAKNNEQLKKFTRLQPAFDFIKKEASMDVKGSEDRVKRWLQNKR